MPPCGSNSRPIDSLGQIRPRVLEEGADPGVLPDSRHSLWTASVKDRHLGPAFAD